MELKAGKLNTSSGEGSIDRSLCDSCRFRHLGVFWKHHTYSSIAPTMTGRGGNQPLLRSFRSWGDATDVSHEW